MTSERERSRKAIAGIGSVLLFLASCLLANVGCRPSAKSEASGASQKPLAASLLGHWVTEDGGTHRYFSTDTVIMVDQNRLRPQSYKLVKSSEPEGTMTITCEGKNDQYALPGGRPVFYDLEFSKDRKAVSTRTYIREGGSPVTNRWTYVDSAREP